MALGLVASLVAGSAWSDGALAGEPTAGPSRGRTILMSAAVPGWGQLAHGRKGAATGFMLGEIASWASLVTFRIQGDLRRDRYIEYAQRFAGIQDATGQSNDYYRALGRYDRSDPGPGSYNELEVRLPAKRELYPDDQARQDEYIRENSITGGLAWNWESEERRRQYARIRSSSESSFHRAEFAIGGLVAGRLLSLMHALWFTGRQPAETSLHLRTVPFAEADLARGESRLGVRARF